MLPFIKQKENGEQEKNDVFDPSECREQKLFVLCHKETNDKERVHEQVLICVGKQGNKQHPKRQVNDSEKRGFPNFAGHSNRCAA